MNKENLKHDLRILEEARQAFELSGWVRTGSIQKEPRSNSTAYGTVHEKDGKKFYLNIETASRALSFLNKF